MSRDETIEEIELRLEGWPEDLEEQTRLAATARTPGARASSSQPF